MKKLAIFAALALSMPLAAAPQLAQAQSAPDRQPETISYGSHALQAMTFYPADTKGKRPLIVFVHGGAWIDGDMADSTGQAKIKRYPKLGYHFATVNYRLLPEAEIETQAEDVAAAVAKLMSETNERGVDRERVVLMGHSAGAHLAALVGTDPRLLKAHGLSPADIAGVVSIDGAALDVPRQIALVGPLMRIGLRMAFTSDEAMQNKLSPRRHVDSENAGRFLLLHVERRDAATQAREFAEALNERGTKATVAGFPGVGMAGHNAINSKLGREDYEATATVDEWLAEVFG